MATVTSSCAAVQKEVHIFSLSRLSGKISLSSSSLSASPFLWNPLHFASPPSQTAYDLLSQRHNKLCHFIMKDDLGHYGIIFLAGEDQQ